MFLVLLLGSIGMKGWTAFVQTRIHLDIHLDPARLDVQNLATANYGANIASPQPHRQPHRLSLLPGRP